MSAATLTGLAGWLHATLAEPEPLKRSGAQALTRVALALEPRDLPDDVNVDAVFLHRSHHANERWPGLGILGAHDGFDLHLTTGPNHRLARVLGWQDVLEVTREHRVVGVNARPPQRTWHDLRTALQAELGGEDTSFPPTDTVVTRVALMNAMTPALIEDARGQGVHAYLTGQLRPSAVPVAHACGMGVIALGHRRTELWGLRTLAREMEAAFPGLATQVYGEI
ncbi:Nif3-like dinuclear metal center hexameric protein [Deinococcus sp.]|uniref:Nif3-like dinuclear metal center hexameric protein n=1 Tax=Deinococcus sp. TaxID=47478 RepID=UPI002869A6EC|nr:Nif3-like dinuclear metal center hexameric protein [Deinococcus sp.]